MTTQHDPPASADAEAPRPPPFSDAGWLATAHGVACLLHLPDGPDPVAPSILARLAPAEAAHASTLGGYRQVSFVGGRLALHAAMARVGVPDAPVLPDARGTPVLPGGWTGSISHKRTLAVGMVARADHGTLGIDLETRRPARLGVAERVLRPKELTAIQGLPEEERWMALLLRFSTKEAIYKAVDPWVRRWVGFHEAEVHPDLDGRSRVALHLDPDLPGLRVDARYRWLPGHVLTTVRIEPPTGA